MAISSDTTPMKSNKPKQEYIDLLVARYNLWLIRREQRLAHERRAVRELRKSKAKTVLA